MEKRFYHALKIDDQICIGCTRCMHICPTEAIRIRKGKAFLIENRCVDCGECFKTCPVSAISIHQDDFSRLNSYTHKIALVPSVFLGQFPESYTQFQIYNAILSTGFTHIFEVELGTGILLDHILKYNQGNLKKTPLISSFCPAIIRLIQVKFPALVDHIMLLKPPLDITALYCRKKLADEGVNPAEIGVFYISPCPAKIAAIKSPVGEDYSVINGVINMDMLFNRVSRILASGLFSNENGNPAIPISEKAMNWTLTHGEASHIPGRSLAIDGIHNVMEFLEKVENEEVDAVDFLELRACDESCAGGVLVNANRFLVAERLHNNTIGDKEGNINEQESEIEQYRDYLSRRITIQEIKPRSMMKLDESMAEAMKKMDKAAKLMELLPLVDCGFCGSPNCNAFSLDIVQGEAEIRQCIFIQKRRENTGEMTPEESLALQQEIWGKDKFQS